MAALLKFYDKLQIEVAHIHLVASHQIKAGRSAKEAKPASQVPSEASMILAVLPCAACHACSTVPTSRW